MSVQRMGPVSMGKARPRTPTWKGALGCVKKCDWGGAAEFAGQKARCEGVGDSLEGSLRIVGCHGETPPGVPALVKSLSRSGVRARRSREHSLGGAHGVDELACPSAGGAHGLQSTWHALQHPL